MHVVSAVFQSLLYVAAVAAAGALTGLAVAELRKLVDLRFRRG